MPKNDVSIIMIHHFLAFLILKFDTNQNLRAAENRVIIIIKNKRMKITHNC